MKNYEVRINDGWNSNYAFSGTLEECEKFVDDFDGDEECEIYEEE